MDTNELRRLAREVDEEHRDSMRTLRDEIGDTVLGASDEVRSSRRSFLRGAGLGGAAITVGAATIAIPAMVASAQTDGTTTTAPPQRPTTEDTVLLSFAQSLELAAVDAYSAAAGTGLISEEVLPVALTFQQHHRDHAQAYAALLGTRAPGVANQSVLAAFGPQIARARDEQALLQVAFDLETAAASTYLLALGLLESTDAAATAAAILPTESRHAVVLGEALELDITDYVPTFESTNSAVNPADYPILEGR